MQSVNNQWSFYDGALAVQLGKKQNHTLIELYEHTDSFVPSDSTGAMEDSWEMVEKGEGSAENVVTAGEDDASRDEVIHQPEDDISDAVMVDPENGGKAQGKGQDEEAPPEGADGEMEVTPGTKDLPTTEDIGDADKSEILQDTASPENAEKPGDTEQMVAKAESSRETDPSQMDRDQTPATRSKVAARRRPQQSQRAEAMKVRTDIECEMDTDDEEDLLSPRSFADVQRMLAGYRDDEVRSVKIYTPDELERLMQLEQEEKRQGQGSAEQPSVESTRRRDEPPTVQSDVKTDQDLSTPRQLAESAGIKPDAREAHKSWATESTSGVPDDRTLSAENCEQPKVDDTCVEMRVPARQKSVEVEELFEGDSSSEDSTDAEGEDYTLDYTLEDIEEAIEEVRILLLLGILFQTKFP